MGAMDIQQIMKMLPHRYPFLMVDRILKIEGNHITGVKNVTINEPYFPGAFSRGIPSCRACCNWKPWRRWRAFCCSSAGGGQPDRVFHGRREREMAQTGGARRRAGHRGGTDQVARQNRQGQGRLQGGRRNRQRGEVTFMLLDA
jgi:hypothetical protein